MSDMRCPSCGATETIWVKTAWAWRPAMVGWPWARRLEVVRQKVGECVVCLRCDWPYVVTPSGPFVKARGPAVPPRPTGGPNPRPVDPVADLLNTVNAMPDEPA